MFSTVTLNYSSATLNYKNGGQEAEQCPKGIKARVTGGGEQNIVFGLIIRMHGL